MLDKHDDLIYYFAKNVKLQWTGHISRVNIKNFTNRKPIDHNITLKHTEFIDYSKWR